MVDAGHSGRGAGRALGERVLEQARSDGYLAMQFNAVIGTTPAQSRALEVGMIEV